MIEWMDIAKAATIGTLIMFFLTMISFIILAFLQRLKELK